MPNFCGKCGATLAGPFCGKCGADMRNFMGAPPQSPPQAVVQIPSLSTTPTPPPATPKRGMSTLAKLAIAAVAIIFVGGAAGVVGVYYVAHRISQRIHQAADGILGSNSDSASGPASSNSYSSSATNTAGGAAVCRLLSKEDVGHSIGIDVIRALPGDNSCTYMAKGTQSDMAAKHATAMLAARGADAKTQQMLGAFASGVGKMVDSAKPASERDNSGEAAVFSFSIDTNGPEAQMQLNRKGLGILGDQQQLAGIGDDAFVSAEGMMFVRKGRNLIRIVYVSCPCGTEQVKPLAKEIADSL